MIVFLDSDKNNFTTLLNPPIKANRVRLLSCSLYNSWYNLIGGVATVNQTARAIPDSHYTPQTLAKELAKYQIALTTGLPHEWGLVPDANVSVDINQPIKDLIGYKTVGGVNTFHWKVPQNYEVHCDLVHTCHNGAPSHLMAQFAAKGKPFDVVDYRVELEHDLADFLVSQFHIAVKVDGELVNFNKRKINLVLEFI